MGTPSMGVLAAMAIDSALPFDTSSLPLEFVSEKVAKAGTVLSTDGIRGSRFAPAERTRTGTYKVSGPISCAVDSVFLDRMLPYIVGNAGSAGVWTPDSTISTFYLMVDRGAKVYTYAGCKVSKATFKASAGGTLTCDMDIEAQTESVSNSGGFPVLTMPTNLPYVFMDGAVTIASTAYDVFELQITYDNMLNADRFVNEFTRSQMPSKGLEITCMTKHPYSSAETGLYDPASFGAYSLVFTNGAEAGSSLTIDMPMVIYPAESPTAENKDEIALTLNGVAYKSGSTAPITFTNAHS